MQTVLITGATKGIGRALVLKFLNEGFHVIGTSISGALEYTHEHLSVVELDLRSPLSIEASVAEVENLGVRLDIVINNAGVLLDEQETTLIPDLLRQTLEINLVGTAALTEALLPMVEKSGHIIMISSTAGSLDYTGKGLSHFPGHYPAYKISKAGLNMYMRTLAMRIGSAGPVISSVNPGWVRTDIGGANGELSPEEAAADIYTFAVTRPETGKFWFRGEELPW